MPFATEVITQAALETLLWVSTIYDEEGNDIEPADARYSVSDFGRQGYTTMLGHVTDFLFCLDAETTAYLLAHVTAEQIGHDLVLTAQGHGAGFWDRGYPEHIGTALTDWAHTFSIEFEVDDADQPHVR